MIYDIYDSTQLPEFLINLNDSWKALGTWDDGSPICGVSMAAMAASELERLEQECEDGGVWGVCRTVNV